MDKSKTGTCSSQQTELLESSVTRWKYKQKLFYDWSKKDLRAQPRYPICTGCTDVAHSHLFPFTTKSVILLYCMHANWTDFFDCVPNTLILPFPSFTKPVYINWRCTPSSVHLLFSGLLSEERSSLSSHQPSLLFFLSRTFSTSLRGLHFAHSCLMHFLWDRIKWDWRPRKPHAVYLA